MKKPIKPVDTHDSEICAICANKFKYFAIGECDHHVCHICSLRLRALYEKNECAMCKTISNNVIFSSNPDQKYAEFNREELKFEKKYGIYFETENIQKDTMELLVFLCPVSECNYVCSHGWNQLKNHVKKQHSKQLCSICYSHKKIFPFEAALYTGHELKAHIDKGLGDPSFKGHPQCVFCKDHYYSNDELIEHCRHFHEKCFVCNNQGIRDQYFVNYESLSSHFHTSHFPCEFPECVEQRFVVFGSELDLEAHKLDFNYGPPLSRELNRSVESGSTEGLQSNSNTNYPVLNSTNRLNPPSNFGTALTSETTTNRIARFTQSTNQSDSIANPTPLELVDNAVHLSPAQENIFNSDPELSDAILNLFNKNQSSLDKVKILVESFQRGTITVDKLLSEFVQVSNSHSTRNSSSALFSEMGTIWHRISNIFVNDGMVTDQFENLVKKSKKKGLSIKEFELMRLGEPKKSAMLRVWNNYKVKFAQEFESTPRAGRSGWNKPATRNVADDETSISELSNSKRNVTRVLVIKPATQNSAVSRRGIYSGLTSQVGGSKKKSLSSSLNDSRANDNSDFPALPTVNRPVQPWVQEPELINAQENSMSRKKKGKQKQVLLKFG